MASSRVSSSKRDRAIRSRQTPSSFRKEATPPPPTEAPEENGEDMKLKYKLADLELKNTLGKTVCFILETLGNLCIYNSLVSTRDMVSVLPNTPVDLRLHFPTCMEPWHVSWSLIYHVKPTISQRLFEPDGMTQHPRCACQMYSILLPRFANKLSADFLIHRPYYPVL